MFKRTGVGLFCLLMVAASAMAIMLGGCGDKPPEYGSKKEDWAKSTPPPSWRGPGQPGGPPAGALNGPVGPPPAAVTAPPAK